MSRKRDRSKRNKTAKTVQPEVVPVTEIREGQSVSSRMSVLSDSRDTAKDIGLLNVAIRKRWPVTETAAKKIVRRLMDVVEKRSVSVITSDGGIFECESTADKNANAASKTLCAFMAQNQRDEIEHARRNNPKQPSNTTVNVGVNVANNLDERRDRTRALLERAGAERGISLASSGGSAILISGDGSAQ